MLNFVLHAFVSINSEQIRMYVQVRCRKRDELDLTDAEMRKVEAEWFSNSSDFGASPPCSTGVPALVAKLEDLQWNVYKRVLPGLRGQVRARMQG